MIQEEVFGGELVQFVPLVVIRIVFCVVVSAVVLLARKGNGVLELSDSLRNEIGSLGFSDKLHDSFLLVKFEAGDFRR